MTWGEAISLTTILAQDTSSRVGAKLHGHSRPWPVEAWILANIFDLLAVANSRRRPPPYERPNSPEPVKLGKTALSQAQVRAALAARGHR